MSQPVLLPPGTFTRTQAEFVTAAYRNITIEDEQRSYFRLVIRDPEGGWSGGHGILNLMPVPGLTRISGNMAF